MPRLPFLKKEEEQTSDSLNKQVVSETKQTTPTENKIKGQQPFKSNDVMKVSFFIDRPVFSAVISIVIVIVGIIGLTMLPVDQYPQITPPVVKISASYPGASALTVFAGGGNPYRAGDKRYSRYAIYGVQQFQFWRIFGYGHFRRVCRSGFGCRRNTESCETGGERLPAEVIQNGISVEKQAPSQLMTICLTSSDPKFDEIYLSNFATINVLDLLRRIPGVGRVSNIGSRYYAMQIWALPDKLANFGLTVQDLQNALKDQNRESAAGVFGTTAGEWARHYYPYHYSGTLKFGKAVLRILWSVPMPTVPLFVCAMWLVFHWKHLHIVRRVESTVRMLLFSVFICFPGPMQWKLQKA